MIDWEPWMLGEMEEEGLLDTRESYINRLAKYFKENDYTDVGNDEFIEACRACGIDPYSFNEYELREIEKRANQ